MLEKEIEELSKLGKPIIHCNHLEFRLKGYDYFNTIIWHTKKGLVQKYFTNYFEEKDGCLVTDDFIFIKESLYPISLDGLKTNTELERGIIKEFPIKEQYKSLISSLKKFRIDIEERIKSKPEHANIGKKCCLNRLNRIIERYEEV